MEGWVLLHRRFLEWEWWDKAEMVQVFLYLLLNANHADQKWRGVRVKRGQLVTSVAKIASDTGLSVQTVRTCIKRLKSTSEITSKSTSAYTIITICNYGKYQDDAPDTNKQNNKPSNKRLTSKQQTANKRLTTNNNENNENNENNNISLSLERETEREEIFKLFFLKNFVEPANEVERFYSHYEAQGWDRGNGRKIRNRLAAARNWEQVDRTKRRFPEPFISALRDICARMTPEDAATVMHGIDKIEINAREIWIYCVSPVHKILEANGPKTIAAAVGRDVCYRVKKVN